jgi:hypothetical protein
MSFTPDTNYYITKTNPDGSNQTVDLSDLFNGGASNTITNLLFKNPNGIYVDINTIFNARTSETPIAETGYKVPVSGIPTDLNLIFQPKLLPTDYFTISPGVQNGWIYPYKTLNSGGYFYILITYMFGVNGGNLITFNQPINGINIVMAGGGGMGIDGMSGAASGKGGGGGGVVHATFNAVIGDEYTLVVGYGGSFGGGMGGSASTFIKKPDTSINLTVSPSNGAGIGGNITSSNGFTVIGGGSGGNGGEVVTVAGGKNSSNNGTPSALPKVTLPTTPPIYLGGGGGAGDWTIDGSSAFGGTAGSNVSELGGECGAFIGSVTGENGYYNGTQISYGKFGSGGGGGAYNPTTGNNGNVSYGGTGVILIYFPI